jgi:hypothetical protein
MNRFFAAIFVFACLVLVVSADKHHHRQRLERKSSHRSCAISSEDYLRLHPNHVPQVIKYVGRQNDIQFDVYTSEHTSTPQLVGRVYLRL